MRKKVFFCLDFDLMRYLNRGGLPHVCLSEEIEAEALVRRVDRFARFLDVMALQNGEALHYQGLSSDAGVPARTVESCVHILEDTLIGFSVPSFLATRKRKAITRAKFFLFDVGVVNTLAVEFKSSACVSERHLRGLRALREEGLVRDYAVVSPGPSVRAMDGIKIYPWKEFLAALWGGEVLGS